MHLYKSNTHYRVYNNIFLSQIRNPFFNSQIIQFLIAHGESKYLANKHPLSEYNGSNPTFHQTLTERKIKKFESNPAHILLAITPLLRRRKGSKSTMLAIVPRNLHDPPFHPSTRLQYSFSLH